MQIEDKTIPQRVRKTTKVKSLTNYDIINHEAQEFLDSMARNSKSTQTTYATALLAFHKFMNGKYTLQSIIEPLRRNELDVYKVLNDFVTYLMRMPNKIGSPIALKTLDNYMTAIRSYFQFYDVDIASARFKRKVKMPRLYGQDEEAIDAADIRTIMLSCNNRRLKPYLLVLASAGLRATEACAIRICDIEFDSNPTKINIKREYAKTRIARDVYISDEATRYLHEWLNWKYRRRRICPTILGDPIKTGQKIPKDSDLVFTRHQSVLNAKAIYFKIRNEFVTLLGSVGFERRKEGQQRRTITLHSFRRYVKKVISDQVSKDYSEWFLGHSKSPYYTMKESMRREIYESKCMRYLTYLDYSALGSTGRNIQAQLDSKEEGMQKLRVELRELKSQLSSEVIIKVQELTETVDMLAPATDVENG